LNFYVVFKISKKIDCYYIFYIICKSISTYNIKGLRITMKQTVKKMGRTINKVTNDVTLMPFSIY